MRQPDKTATQTSKKVLFLLECGSKDAQGLRAVTALVDGQSAEVAGLFIEDEDLMNAARFPGSTEISLHSREVTQLDATRMQQALVQQAFEIQQLFEQSARRLKLRHSFRVTRGRLMEKLLESAAAQDLLVVGRPLLAPGFRARTGVHFAQLLPVQQDVLFINEPWDSGSTIIVLLHDRGAPADNVIGKARAIADAENLQLIIAYTGKVDAQLLSQADQLLPLHGVDDGVLVDLCAGKDARLLVISGMDDWHNLLVGLLNRLSCSLLLLK